MICFIVGADGQDGRLRSLAGIVGSLGYTAQSVPDLDALSARADYAAAVRPLVLIPDLASGSLAERAVAFAQAQRGRAFVVYIADALTPGLYKQLVRTQSGDWIAWETFSDELRDLVATLGAPEASARGATIVSFLPSKGGVGNTTLVAETGVHLSTRRRRGLGRVALLDLNLQGGTLADALDVEPRFDIGEIVERPERLDEQLVDIFTSRHSPRLDVFAGPNRRIALDQVPAPIVFTIIDAIAKRYETILIDLPPVWLPWIDNILHGSDAVVASGGSTVPALRKLSGLLAQLDALKLSASRLAVAVNPCDADLLGRITRKGEIERALPGRELFFVRRDSVAACGALDAGRSLLETTPNARVGRDIRRLAEWVGTQAGAA